MAVKVATTSGNLTTAGTWQDVNATSFSDYESSTQFIDATWRGAGTFTPGAIQVDGIIIKVAYRAAVPSGNFSVRLYNSTDAGAVAGTQVDIGVSDLTPIGVPEQQTVLWVYMKFAAPVTLTAGKAYIVQASASGGGSLVYMFYSGVNYTFARGLVLTGAAAAAPTTGDQLIIGAVWTGVATKTDIAVTMDQTSSAVKYGSTSTSLSSIHIGNYGTLAFAYAAATNYYFNVQGVITVSPYGTITIGTVANPIPRDSTATFNFDITGSSGAYWMRLFGTFIAQGLSRTSGKNVVGCLLTANHTAGGTTFTVDRDTGWKSGDTIIVAGTQRASNKADSLTLSVDASSNTLTTGASSFDHAGVAASGIQAEVILTTRNVTVSVTTVGKNAHIWAQVGCTFDADWTTFRGISNNYSSAYRGLSFREPASLGIDYCHFDGYNDSAAWGFSQHSNQATAWGGQTFSNITFTRMQDYLFFVQAPTTTQVANHIQFVDCWGVGYGTYVATGFVAFNTTSQLTLLRCRLAGHYSANVHVNLGNSTRPSIPIRQVTIQDCVFHDAPYGISVPGTNVGPVYIKNCLFYRLKTTGSLTGGITVGAQAGEFLIEDCQFLSAQHYSIYLSSGRSVNMVFRNCKFGGEASYSTPNAIYWNSASGNCLDQNFRFENCLFGDAAGGVYTDHTTSDFDCNAGMDQVWKFVMVNCLSGTATKFSSTMLGGFLLRGFIAYQREQGVLGTHRIYYPRLGTVARDATVYRSSPASEKMTPSGATADFKLRSVGKRFDVVLGSQRSPSVWVYVDVSYNGSAPRLMMKANPAIGQDYDAVLATHSLVTGSWVQLTGTMPTVSEDEGQVEVYVDCDGTAGNVWVDDWAI